MVLSDATTIVESEAKVNFLLIFAELVAGLLLLGVLVRHGLWARDPFFSGYLVFFLGTTAGLWLAAQRYWNEPWYAAAYSGLYAISFLLAFALLSSNGANTRVIAILTCVGFYLVLDFPRRSAQVNLEGFFAVLLLVFGLAALARSWSLASAFDHIKLQGLALFWLAQCVPSFLYWYGADRFSWAESTTKIAGLLAFLAFAWMAIAFSSSGLEGSRQALPEFEFLGALTVLRARLERRKLS